MRVSLVPVAVMFGSGVALAASTPAAAQAVRGSLGARSQATIRISVSVAPRFAIGQLPGSIDKRPAAPPIWSITPGLRYTIVADAPDELSRGAKEPDRRTSRVYLVSPD